MEEWGPKLHDGPSKVGPKLLVTCRRELLSNLGNQYLKSFFMPPHCKVEEIADHVQEMQIAAFDVEQQQEFVCKFVKTTAKGLGMSYFKQDFARNWPLLEEHFGPHWELSEPAEARAEKHDSREGSSAATISIR